MTNDERDKAIFDLSAALDRFDDRFLALQSCFVVALCISALMIFLVVWFGGVKITIVNESPCFPANVGELVETLETVDPETPLGKEKTK